MLTASLKLGLLCGCAWTWASLIALWAGTSRRHWFLRTAAVVGTWVLLQIAACYDGEFFFVIHTTSVTAVAWGWSRFFEKRNAALATRESNGTSDPRPTFQLSLRDLMLACVVVAALGASVHYLKNRGELVWSDNLLNIIQTALASAAVTLSITSLAFCRRWRSGLIAVPVFIACFAFAYQIWQRADWIPGVFRENMNVNWESTGWFFCTTPLVILLLFHCSRFSRFGKQQESVLNLTPRRVSTIRALLFLSAALTALPLVWGFVILVQPIAIPQQQIPEPNSYEEILKLALELDRLPSTWEDDSITSNDIYSKSIRPKLPAVHAALSRPGRKQLTFTGGLNGPDSNGETLARLRDLGYLLGVDAAMYRMDGRIQESLDNSLACLKLGNLIPRGGLISDALVGPTIEHHGRKRLWQIRNQLTVEQLQTVIASLQQCEIDREPLHITSKRQMLWTKLALGWRGRLFVVLKIGFFDISPDRIRDQKPVCEERLLQIEMALEAFHLECKKFPDQLAELAPRFLERVPVDPYSDMPFVYRREANSYRLYSIGPDGKDDGGNEEFWPKGDLSPEIIWGDNIWGDKKPENKTEPPATED